MKIVDDAAARKVPGTKFIVPFGVGVVAENFWWARKGRKALAVGSRVE